MYILGLCGFCLAVAVIYSLLTASADPKPSQRKRERRYADDNPHRP